MPRFFRCLVIPRAVITQLNVLPHDLFASLTNMRDSSWWGRYFKSNYLLLLDYCLSPINSQMSLNKEIFISRFGVQKPNDSTWNDLDVEWVVVVFNRCLFQPEWVKHFLPHEGSCLAIELPGLPNKGFWFLYVLASSHFTFTLSRNIFRQFVQPSLTFRDLHSVQKLP